MTAKINFTEINQRIIEKAMPVDRFLRCGVYFLIKDSVVVYVGKSTCVDARIKTHLSPNGIPFDKVYFYAVPLHKINYFEEHFIKIMKPIYNIHNAINSAETSMNMNELRQQFKIGPDVVTPDGYFESPTAAADHHKVSRQSVYSRIKAGMPGWSYFSEYDYPNPRALAMRRGRPRSDF